VKRRDFITLVGGVTASWPRAARAQSREQKRRIGALMNFTAEDPEAQARAGALAQGLAELGWRLGYNVRVDYRWGTDSDLIRRNAVELVESKPDVIVGSSTLTVGPLRQLTRTLPIVFVNVIDPVGAGFVASLARPGGNATGFAAFEYSLSLKWLELLKEMVPGLTRVAVIRNPSRGAGTAQFAAVQGAASALRVEVTPVDASDASEMERSVAMFARAANGALIVTAGGTAFQRDPIIAMAARHRLPAVYPFSYWITSGGMISYGPDAVDQFRRAAGYVDRILKGEKPADLPVQAPVKYELVINLKTAKALGLTVPDTMLARADEVIE
jgi:ABC-type uncharacterized transport system substrate-binding protein